MVSDRISRTDGRGNTQTTGELSPDLDMAVEFLRKLHPEAEWETLTSIIPDGPTFTRSLSEPAKWRDFIATKNIDQNLYYSLNPTRERVTKKANKTQIAAILYLLADCDPDEGETPAAAKARYLASAAKLRQKPTACIDSGNGLQFLWRLKVPIELTPLDRQIDDKEEAVEQFEALNPIIKQVEALNKALMNALRAKAGTQSIDRILRLPGTVNFPNKVKLAAVRSPCLATQREFNDLNYELKDFDDIVAKAKASTAAHDGGEEEGEGEGHNLEDIIKYGRYGRFPDKNGKPDRSAAVWWVTNECLRRGYVHSAIMSVLLDKANRISEHVLAQSNPVKYAVEQIRKAAAEVGDAIPRIHQIEIRPGDIETFKVKIGDGTVMVDAETLNDQRRFNRACIAQAGRSYAPLKAKAWNNEVDRSLRVASKPARVEEQIRRHGTAAWPNEPISWLVRERIPQVGVGLLAGMFSTYKSFVLLDVCGSVMTGLTCLNARTTRRGGVLIFAAEGASDLPIRVKAMVDHRLARETADVPDLFTQRGIDLGRLPLSFVGCCRPLLQPRSVDWMIEKAREEQAYFQSQFGLGLVLIGIDTMSAAAGWEDENDAAQAQIVLNHLADVSKATQAFVLAVDHFGKDISAGTRGSVVKESSADTILAILGERDEETNVTTDTRVVLRKSRSGPQGDTFPFEAKLVDMGLDRYEEALTSRIIDWNVERPEPKPKPKKKTEAQLTMEQAVIQVHQGQSERITVNGNLLVAAVREEHVLKIFDELYQRGRPDMKPGTLRKARHDGFKAMEESLMHEIIDGVSYVWYRPGPI